MADFDYSGDGAALGESMKDWLSPLDAAGIDPDEARANQAEAMAKVQAGGYEEGEDPNGEGGGQQQQQETPRPSPGFIRRAQPSADAAQVAPVSPTPPATDAELDKPFTSYTDDDDYSPASVQKATWAAWSRQALPNLGWNTGVAPASAAPAPARVAAQTPASAAPAPAPAPAPAAASTPTWADYARQGMNGLGTNMNEATAAAKRLAASPDLAAINAPAQAEYAKYSMPLDPKTYKLDPKTRQPVVDPKTGLNVRITDPDYKESVGGKILRGLEGTAAGVMRGGVLGGIVGAIDPNKTVGPGHGYSDPNDYYGKKVAMRKQIAKSDVDQMAQNKTAFDAATAREKELATAQAGAGTMAHNLATAAAGQQNADSTTQQRYNESPQGKADAAELISKQEYYDRMRLLKDKTSPLSKMSPADQPYYLATGKPRTPPDRQPSAEEIIFNRAAAADLAQHPKGWKPTLSDIRNYAAATKGTDPTAAADSRSQATNLRQLTTRYGVAMRALMAAQHASTTNWDTKKTSGLQGDVDKAQKEVDDIEGQLNAPQTSANAVPAPTAGPAGPIAAAAPMVPGRPGIPARPASSRPAPSRPPNVPRNYVAFTDSNGADHWIAPKRLATAKQRDPGLRTY